MSVNATTRILPYTDSSIGLNGVILPHSSRVLFESDIDSKIQKAKNQIQHLSNAQANRTTHGGKRFRVRQIALKNQTDSAVERLALLQDAKKHFPKQKKEVSPLVKEEEKDPLSMFDEFTIGIFERSPYAALFNQSRNS